RVREIGQLFHSLDPLPYRERDLDERVEEYVVGWAGELPKTPIEIVVHLPPEEAEREDARHIDEAIRNYFAYRAEVAGWELTCPPPVPRSLRESWGLIVDLQRRR